MEHVRTITRTALKEQEWTRSRTRQPVQVATTMDKVCQDHEPLIITRSGQQSVVMLSLDDFKSLEETAYLLRSPENAKRLLSAVTALSKGKGKERQLTK